MKTVFAVLLFTQAILYFLGVIVSKRKYNLSEYILFAVVVAINIIGGILLVT